MGTITSAAWSPELGAWVALGYLHRSVEAPGPVRVRSGDGVGGSRPARVAPAALLGRPAPTPSRAERNGRTGARSGAADRPGRPQRRRSRSLVAAGGLRAGRGGHDGLHRAGRHRDGAPDRRPGRPGAWCAGRCVPRPLRRSARTAGPSLAGLGRPLRRGRGVGAGRVRRPGQPGRPPDAELHGRCGRSLLRLKALVFFRWLCLGAAIVRRGTPAPCSGEPGAEAP